MFTHLEWIDKVNIDNPPPKRLVWHYLWAWLFNLFSIERSEIFLRASIIHYTQFVISFLSLLYFSNTFYKLLITNITKEDSLRLSFWSTALWFITLATYSMGTQQVWILWYSINYQITLPLSFVIAGLTLQLIYFEKKFYRKIILFLIITGFSLYIMASHAMEFIYYLIWMLLLALSYLPSFIRDFFKNFYRSIAIIVLVSILTTGSIIVAQKFLYRSIPLLQYFNFDKIENLPSDIIKHGYYVVSLLSRADYVLNIAITISVFTSIVIFIIYLFSYFTKREQFFRGRFVWLLIAGTLLIYIPTTVYTAGLAALLSYDSVVHRFYFSTLLFLALPALVYWIQKQKNYSIYFLHIGMVVVIIGFMIYSKVFTQKQIFYKNIRSLYYSIENRDRFNLNSRQIHTIGKILDRIQKDHPGKKLYFYARSDIAFVLKYIYRQHVRFHRRGVYSYKVLYEKEKRKSYLKILFPVPEGFPPYSPYK